MWFKCLGLAQVGCSSVSRGSDWCHLLAFDCGWSTLEGPKKLHSHLGPSTGMAGRLGSAGHSPLQVVSGPLAWSLRQVSFTVAQQTRTPTQKLLVLLKARPGMDIAPLPLFSIAQRNHTSFQIQEGKQTPPIKGKSIQKNIWASLNHHSYKPRGKD